MQNPRRANLVDVPGRDRTPVTLVQEEHRLISYEGTRPRPELLAPAPSYFMRHRRIAEESNQASACLCHFCSCLLQSGGPAYSFRADRQMLRHGTVHYWRHVDFDLLLILLEPHVFNSVNKRNTITIKERQVPYNLISPPSCSASQSSFK